MRRLIAQLFALLIALPALTDPIGTPGGSGTGLAPGAINDLAFFALNLCPNAGEHMVRGVSVWTCAVAGSAPMTEAELETLVTGAVTDVLTNADFGTAGTSPVATGPDAYTMQDVIQPAEIDTAAEINTGITTGDKIPSRGTLTPGVCIEATTGGKLVDAASGLACGAGGGSADGLGANRDVGDAAVSNSGDTLLLDNRTELGAETMWGKNIFTTDDSYFECEEDTLAAADQNRVFDTARGGYTVTSAWCACDGAMTTSPTLDLEDGEGNDMTMVDVTCGDANSATRPTVQTVTANNVIGALESVAWNVTNVPAPTTVLCQVCIERRFTP